MKKRIKKVKFKGTRYVAKVLQKYFKKKYPNYNSALPKAREVANQLKTSGQKFTVKNVEALVRKHRLPKTPDKLAPKLFYKLLTPVPYFELLDYPTYIHGTPSEIHFKSNLFNLEVEDLQGGQRPEFKKTFAGFVNFVNKIVHQDRESNLYETDYLIVCTPVTKNPTTKQWETEIISVNSSGDPTDYGYVSEPSLTTEIKKPELKPGKPSKETAKVIPKKAVQKIAPTTKSEKVQQLEAETKKLYQENYNMAMKLFVNKDISKLEFKQMIDDLNKK